METPITSGKERLYGRTPSLALLWNYGNMELREGARGRGF